MSETKFTPGPYKPMPLEQTLEGLFGTFLHDKANGYPLAFVLRMRNSESNLALFAAAPDLYRALKLCLEDLKIWRAETLNFNYDDPVDSTNEAIKQAELVLAKARGEQP